MIGSNVALLKTSYGPMASFTVGPLKVGVELDGEIARAVNIERGYAHKGVEKIAEKLTWTGNLPLVERVDYLASVHYSVAYCQAVESLNQIILSERAEHIRVLVLELNRISSHLFFLYQFCQRIGAQTAAMFFLRDREVLNNLFENLCGARVTYNYIRIGGVSFDVTEGFLEKTREALDYLSPKMAEYDVLLFKNPIFMGRTQGVGVLPLSFLRDHSVTGPSLRASGGTEDLRYDRPYAGYSKVLKTLVRMPQSTEAGCDVYSRVRQRILEIKNSIEIIRGGLKSIPGGKYTVDKCTNEKYAKGSAYSAVEGPRGRIGVWISSDGSSRPARVRFLSPSVASCVALGEALIGQTLGDLATIAMSLDISMSEVDK